MAPTTAKSRSLRPAPAGSSVRSAPESQTDYRQVVPSELGLLTLEATLDEALWPTALGLAAKELGAVCVALAQAQGPDQTPVIGMAAHPDHPAGAGFPTVVPSRLGLTPGPRRGSAPTFGGEGPVCGAAYLPVARQLGGSQAAAALRRYRYLRQTVHRASVDCAALVAFRLGSDPGFEEPERQLMAALGLLLERGFGLAAKREARPGPYGRPDAFRPALDSGVLEAIPLAVLMLRADCRFVYANPAARRRLERPAALSLCGDRLTAVQPEEGRRLAAFIAAVAAGEASREGRKTGRLLRLGGPAALDTVLRAQRLPVGPDQAGDDALVLCTAAGVADRAGFEADALQLFGLTPAEARLAFVMAGGANAKEAARALGITPNTARTHIKRIFEKTGARRQADLPRLLSLLGLMPD